MKDQYAPTHRYALFHKTEKICRPLIGQHLESHVFTKHYGEGIFRGFKI